VSQQTIVAVSVAGFYFFASLINVQTSEMVTGWS